MVSKIRFMNPRWILTVAVAGLVVTVLGCGDDGFGQSRYKVKGKVTYNGTPVEKGEISFVPVGAGRAATGQIKNGYYALTTLSEGDGAVPGKYKVTITSRNVDFTAAQEKVKGLAPGAALPQDLIGQAYQNAKNNIPSKYGLAETTTLTAEVIAGSNPAFDYDLKD
jgi:hypothetical protein